MTERQLEEKMHAFLAGDADVLVVPRTRLLGVLGFRRVDPDADVNLLVDVTAIDLSPLACLRAVWNAEVYECAERVDTRVLQVIYAFDPATFPVYVGQQVDVFIATPASDSTASGK